ncbi:MAG TPA: hypothetical protein VHG08_15100 [Longimicrobium sp.]|nr:hypothetical protein [Longimicrobium sp.]
MRQLLVLKGINRLDPRCVQSLVDRLHPERPPEVLYAPVRPGWEFQPYQISTRAGGVRGE